MEELAQLRPRPPVGPWLRRLAVVSVAELDRAERRQAPATAECRPGGAPGSDDHVVALDLRRELRAAFGALTARDRNLLWRHDVEDLRYDALAPLAGGSAVGARQAVSRARRRLRVAYLAVVDTGNGCVVAVAAAATRWRQRAADRADAACERLVPLVSATTAAAVAAVAGVVVVQATTAATGTVPYAATEPSAAGADSPLRPAAGTSPTTSTGPLPPSPGAPAATTPSTVAVPSPAAVRAGPAGADGAFAVEQPTPAGDAIWYQGAEVRCDRSAVLGSTCAVLRATPAGDGFEVAPTAPARELRS